MMHAPGWILAAVLVLLPTFAVHAGAPGKDAGESRAMMKLKERTKAPKPADIDPAVGLDALLTKNGEQDWSADKAGIVIGTVVQVEHEEDGDIHVVLAPEGKETDTKNWVIAEVTQAWRKKAPQTLAASKLNKLKGKQVKVTGWLFYEPDSEAPDPRGTRWELHPVTNISPVDAPINK